MEGKKLRGQMHTKPKGMGRGLEVSRVGSGPGVGTHRVTSGNNGTFTSSQTPQRGPNMRLSPVFRASLTEQALAGAQVGES